MRFLLFTIVAVFCINLFAIDTSNLSQKSKEICESKNQGKSSAQITKENNYELVKLCGGSSTNDEDIKNVIKAVAMIKCETEKPKDSGSSGGKKDGGNSSGKKDGGNSGGKKDGGKKDSGSDGVTPDKKREVINSLLLYLNTSDLSGGEYNILYYTNSTKTISIDNEVNILKSIKDLNYTEVISILNSVQTDYETTLGEVIQECYLKNKESIDNVVDCTDENFYYTWGGNMFDMEKIRERTTRAITLIHLANNQVILEDDNKIKSELEKIRNQVVLKY